MSIQSIYSLGINPNGINRRYDRISFISFQYYESSLQGCIPDSQSVQSPHSGEEPKMFGKNLTAIKDDLALLSLNIQRMEGMEDAAKTAAINHLQETIGLLRFGGQRAAPKKIKLEEGVVVEPAPVVNHDDALFNSTGHEDVVTKLYNGLKPACDICGADFASVGVLSSHVKNDHGNNESVGVSTAKFYNGLTPTCEVCGATFATVGELSTHVKTCHRGNQNPEEEDFICLRCKQPFSSRAILESHTKNPANCEKILKIRERLRERQTGSSSDISSSSCTSSRVGNLL